VLEAPGADSPIWHSNVEKIGALAYAPNGEQFVISADGDGSPRKGGKVLIFDAETREVETLIEYARGSFNHLAFSPDSGRLVLGSYKDRVLVWDMATNAPHCRFNSDDSGQGLRAFKLSPSGQLIATGGGTDNWGYVRIWDTQTCRLQAETILEDRVGSLSFHPHTPFLVAGAWSGEVAIIDLSELKP
jgi:WD40 repeat protein